MSEITHIADLTSDPNNARRHNPRNVGMLERALNEVGAARSIVVDEDGVILAGNATIEAAAQAGITKVQVVDADGDTIIAVRRSGLTSEQKTKLALYDNRVAELAEWEPGILADIAKDMDLSDLFTDVEFDDLSMPALQEAGAGGDEFNAEPDTEGPTRTSLGQLWSIGGKHRLLVGDCTDPANVARLMGGERAQLILTSPPYGVGMEYEEQTPDYDATVALLDNCFAVWCQQVAANGFAFVNFADRYVWPKTMCQVYFDIFTSVNWRWYDQRYWKRSQVGMAIWNTTQPRAMSQVEHLYTFQNGDKLYPVNDLSISKEQLWDDAGSSAGMDHPAVMALGIAEKAAQIYTQRGDVIAEPFLGSGTTLIAAHRTGRRCYGMELSPRYCDVILRRAEAEGLTTELISNE